MRRPPHVRLAIAAGIAALPLTGVMALHTASHPARSAPVAVAPAANPPAPSPLCQLVPTPMACGQSPE